jgi:hypothetical protein
MRNTAEDVPLQPWQLEGESETEKFLCGMQNGEYAWEMWGIHKGILSEKLARRGSRYRNEGNVSVNNVREMGCSVICWIRAPRGLDHTRALVNTVMNLRVARKRAVPCEWMLTSEWFFSVKLVSCGFSALDVLCMKLLCIHLPDGIV